MIQQNRLMDHKWHVIGLGIIFTILRLCVAWTTHGFESVDYQVYLSSWHWEIADMGGLAALQEQVGNYGIPYQFLICLMTYLPISSLSAYKLLSLAFDILLAATSAGIISLLTKGAEERRRLTSILFTYIAVLFLPTVVLNSSVWAQCDSMYTAVGLLALLCLCVKKDIAAFALLGIAMSLKLQTILLVPAFMLIAFMRRRLHYLVVSFVSWYGMCIPGFLAGRSFMSPFDIYREQAGTYQQMQMNFPSVWVLIGGSYEDLGDTAIVVTVVVLAVLMIWWLSRYHSFKEQFVPFRIIELTCLLTWTCVICLPCMHERYSYSVEILLVILTCMNRQFLPCLVGEEILIILRYRAFLFDAIYAGDNVTDVDAILYLCMYILYITIMFKDIQADKENRTII